MPRQSKLTFHTFSASAGKVCYILLPEGLLEDTLAWMEHASKSLQMGLVAVTGMDWNDDLTPWPAEGVFRKAKPFGGQAQAFLVELVEEIAYYERESGWKGDERWLAGVSLSGLFAVWSLLSDAPFDGIISISASLWYDDFVSWASAQAISAPRKAIITLGDREKNSKDRRMCTVQDATQTVCHTLEALGVQVTYLLEEGITHFSPLTPRLDKALAIALNKTQQS